MKYNPFANKKQVNEEEASTPLIGAVDAVNRRIEIRGDVTEQFSSFLFRAVSELEAASSNPIEIILSSFGGDVYETFACYDFLRNSKCTIITKANGKIFSGAFIIFLAGDIRVSYPHSRFMFHTARYDDGHGNTKNKEVQVNESKQVDTKFLDILQSRTKMSRQWWYRNITFIDKFFGVQEAKEYGVLTPEPKQPVKKKVKKNVRKK